MAKETELTAGDIISSLLNVVAYIISPILLIWAVNTLFICGIPMSFKTWLAGFVLIMLLKFHLRGTGNSYENYDDEYYYEEDDDEDDDEYEYEEPHKSKKKSPSDESR